MCGTRHFRADGSRASESELLLTCPTPSRRTLVNSGQSKCTDWYLWLNVYMEFSSTKVANIGQQGKRAFLFICIWLYSPWVAIQASRCAGWVDRIIAVKNPGVSLRRSYENGGRVVPPGTIGVLLLDIPGEKRSLPIRYPDLIRPIYLASLVGI